MKEKISCVYKIKNIITNKQYIGSAVNFNRRKNRHLSDLSKGCHHSLYLQNSYNKYGKDSFIFEILEYVNDVESLIYVEQKWLDVVIPEYNMTLIAGLNCHLGLKRSDETKRKISESLTGRKLSIEHINAMVNGREYRPFTKEEKNKHSEILKNSVKHQAARINPEVIKKIKNTRINNGGYVVSEEQKLKISETLKKQNLQSVISIKISKFDLEDNLIEIYPSMLKAEVDNGIGRGCLYYNIIKKNKIEYKGFKWKIKK